MNAHTCCTLACLQGAVPTNVDIADDDVALLSGNFGESLSDLGLDLLGLHEAGLSAFEGVPDRLLMGENMPSIDFDRPYDLQNMQSTRAPKLYVFRLTCQERPYSVVEPSAGVLRSWEEQLAEIIYSDFNYQAQFKKIVVGSYDVVCSKTTICSRNALLVFGRLGFISPASITGACSSQRILCRPSLPC